MSKFAFKKRLYSGGHTWHNHDVPDKVAGARSKMSPAERKARSELNRLLHSEGILRGNLSLRERKCGKPTCHCMTGGEKHQALYVVLRDEGRFRQVFVPRHLYDVVKKWVENHKKCRDLLEEISKLHYEKIHNREA